MADDVIQVVTTTARKNEAETIASELVTRRLAACVQVIGPMASVFRWQGGVEHSQEWQCQIKTTMSRYAEVEAAIRELHPYEEPEVIAVPISVGSPSYLAWVRKEVTAVASE
jgi:periplasmic divalent cation tolerance protein